MKYLLLIFRNLRRSMVRSGLTALGTMVLVLVVTLVWSILSFLNQVMSERKTDIKMLITEKWQIPSQMPFSYARPLSEGAAREPGDIKPMDSMTWQFVGMTTDIQNRTRENSLFAFAMQPAKLLTMMDDLDTLESTNPALAQEFKQTVEKLQNNRQGLILGKSRLEQLSKKVGDRIKLYGINYRDIDLEFEIVGTFPIARYDMSAAFDADYLNAALEQYPIGHGGKQHPLYGRTLNLVWLKVADSAAFDKVAKQIADSPDFSNPAVKCEVSSAAISTFLDGYRDIIWGMRWIIGPAALISLSVVISNAISISVRERRMELAVMKVLGFRPHQIMLLVLGESLLLGAGAGFISSAATYSYVTFVLGGIKFPIAFFPSFGIPPDALWWGPLVGGLAAILGSVTSAWSACTVKVTDVFSKVA